MAGKIHIGTSGWNYPSGKGTWNGIFYPVPRPKGFDELAFYADHFDVVEVNSTFYRMPEPPQTSRWVERTPSGFLFTVKLYQQFTHPDMYLARGGAGWNPSRTDIDIFRAGIEPLASAGRLGAVMIQFPPSFHAEPATREYLEWLVSAFADYPVAVELRHKSWSDADAETSAILAAHRAAWVLIDEPKFDSSIVQSIAPGPAAAQTTEPLTYMRLHGRNSALWWEHGESEDRYNYLYSPDELAPFADRARADAEAGKKVYLFLNNHFSAKAAANAAVLKRQVGQPVDGEYGLTFRMTYPEVWTNS